MKRVYAFIVCALCTSALFSCTQDRTEDVVVNTVGKDVIYAQVDKEDRVQLNEKRQMSWTAGDVVYVAGRFGNTKKFQAYKFDGATGDVGGSFTAIPELNLYENGSMYDDEHTHKQKIDDVDWWDYYVFKDYMDYAVTPWNGYEVESSDEIFYCYSPNTAQQNYTPDSSDPAMNILVGSSTDGENFEFKNLLGFLRISLTGDKKVKSIVVTENSGAMIAGKFLFNIKDVDASKFLWTSDIIECVKSRSITLDCGGGIQLNGTPTDFYFAMVPTVMKEGFSLVVNFTDDTSFVQSTSKEIEVQRNHIKPMKAINTSNVEYQTITILHTGTTFSAPEITGAETVSDSVTITESVSGFINWGDGNISVLGLFTSYDYTDGLSSHKVVINVRDAKHIKFSSIEGVTDLDLSNF